MTSSDLTQLPDGTKERVAARVGRSVDGTVSGQGGSLDGTGVRIGFACAEFNGGITERLLTGALAAATECGADLGSAVVVWAPGAFELPLIAQQFAAARVVDAVVCLGAVIRGDTGHYDFVAGECARGLQRVQLDTGCPVVFGVLTTDTVEQALVRSMDDETNKGREAAMTAIGMVRALAAIGNGEG